MKKYKLSELKTFDEVFRQTYSDPKAFKVFQKVYEEHALENANAMRTRVAKEIKEARLKAGVKQEELAKLLRTTRSNISRIENGKQNLSTEYLIKIATALKRPFEIRIY